MSDTAPFLRCDTVDGCNCFLWGKCMFGFDRPASASAASGSPLRRGLTPVSPTEVPVPGPVRGSAGPGADLHLCPACQGGDHPRCVVRPVVVDDGSGCQIVCRCDCACSPLTWTRLAPPDDSPQAVAADLAGIGW